MTSWKVWYGDGRSYSSCCNKWENLPDEGALGIVVYQERPYRTIITGGDWYYLENDVPTKKDTHPEWGKWAEPPDVPDSLLKRSASRIGSDQFDAILDEMMNDREWP